MRTLDLLLILLLSLAAVEASAEVFKRVNPDGSVEFTDVPDSQEAEPVELAPITTYPAPPSPPPRSRATPRTEAPAYEAVSITSPSNDETIHDNQGNITITVELSPELKSGHNLRILLDGNQQAEGKSTTFSLTNIDRGSHQIQVQIVDAKGKPLAQSESITVHLKRFSQFFKRN